MKGVAIRIIVVCIAVLFLILVSGPVLSMLGLDIPGNIYQIIKICLAVIALYYIIWGSTPSFPVGN